MVWAHLTVYLGIWQRVAAHAAAADQDDGATNEEQGARHACGQDRVVIVIVAARLSLALPCVLGRVALLFVDGAEEH